MRVQTPPPISVPPPRPAAESPARPAPDRSPAAQERFRSTLDRASDRTGANATPEAQNPADPGAETARPDTEPVNDSPEAAETDRPETEGDHSGEAAGSDSDAESQDDRPDAAPVAVRTATEPVSRGEPEGEAPPTNQVVKESVAAKDTRAAAPKPEGTPTEGRATTPNAAAATGASGEQPETASDGEQNAGNGREHRGDSPGMHADRMGAAVREGVPVESAVANEAESAGEPVEPRAAEPVSETSAKQASPFRLEAEGPGAVKSPTIGGKIGAAQPSPEQASHAQGGDGEERAFVSGVSRGLGAALQQKGGSLMIRLSPESLGSMRIHMTLDQGQVSVRMETISEQAQMLLARSLPALKESLESKGLTVREMQVTPTLHGPVSVAQGSESRHGASGGEDASGDEAWREGEQRGSDAQDRRGGGEEGAGELDERWFEQRLRMTLDAVA